MVSFFLHSDGDKEPVRVQVNPSRSGKYGVEVGETAYTLDYVSWPGEPLFFIWNGKVVPFYALEKKGDISVWMDGKSFRFQRTSLTAKRTQPHLATRVSGEITASMPGRILKVYVKAGEAVVADQPLIVMESMKMEMTLSSSHAAIVQTVMCKEGDQVEGGQTLLRLEGGN